MKCNKKGDFNDSNRNSVTVMTPTKNEDMAEHQNEIYFCSK